ncbi:MAG: hypothetical protein ACTHOD_13950 [Motilibacteraceae bacterium]
MTVWRIWLRRSLAPRLAPLYVVALLWAQYSVKGWQYEWVWGLRAPMRFLVLVSPLLAAAVAFDVARWQPVASALSASTRRWRAATLAVPAAHVAWAFGCIALVLSTAVVRLSLDHAMGRPDLWLPAELLAALVAAASVGLVLGTVCPPGLAAPAAAVVVIAIAALGGSVGLMNTFSPQGAAGSLLMLERDPGAAAFAVLLDVGVVALALALALRGSARKGLWRVGVGVAAAGVLALVAVPGGALPREYRPVASPESCVAREAVRVCGPELAHRHLTDVADAVQQATSMLAASGLPFPHSYVLATPGSPPDPAETRTVVWASTAQLHDDRRQSAIAAALAAPRDCPAMYQLGPDTGPLVDDQAQVSSWIRQALASGHRSAAPPPVVEAYRDLSSCQPEQPSNVPQVPVP